MSDNMKMQLIFDMLNRTDAGFQALFRSFDSLSGKISIISAKFTAIDYVVRRVFNGMKQAVESVYDPVEKFNMSVTKMAAMITSFQSKGDLSSNYAKSKEYAEALVQKMEEVDAKTIASAQDLGLITEEMVKQRVLLDINNEKQIQGFTNIANAVATIAAGSGAREIQIRQEVRALLQGEVNMYSQLATQINAMVGGSLQQKVELWKKEGTIIENVGELLKGYAAASQDIEGTWAAIGSTMETIKNRIARGGFAEAYKEINSMLQRANEFLKEHAAEISGVIKGAWLTIRGLIESVFNLLGGFKEPLGIAAGLVGMIAKGFGLIAYAILPPLTERLGSIIKGMWEWVKLFGNLLSAAGYALQGEFSKAGDMIMDANKNLENAGKYAGQAFSEGFGDEIAGRAGKFLETLNIQTKKAVMPDLGDAPMSDRKKEEARARIDARLKVELQALKEAEIRKVEALKTEEKNLELSYKQGLVTEKEYLDEKNRLQAEALSVSNVYSDLEKQHITKAWEEKKGLFKEEKDRLKEAGEVKAEILKRDEEIAKRNEELTRLGIDAKIQDIEYTKKLAEAKREGELKVLEAEINLRRQLNALKVERGDMTGLEAKRAEIEAEKELLQLRLRNIQAKLQEQQPDAERISLLKERLALQKQLVSEEAQSIAIEREIYGSLWEGYRQGLTKWVSDTKTAFQQGIEIARATAEGMQQAFSDFFFDAFQGKLKSLWDYVKSFLTSVQRVIANALAQKATEGILQAVLPTGWLKKHEGGLVMHTGGSVPSYYIPRFHLGGLNSDERMVINKVGERYITEEQNLELSYKPRTMNNAGGGNINVDIQMNNTTGLPLSLKQTGQRTDEKTRTKTIILDLVFTDLDFINGLKAGLARG
ncbi:MAG: hypothetical protein M1510_10655 [Nitrospirae bacterium]|nr:hypothetical protein [Nitrospirota bacterium]